MFFTPKSADVRIWRICNG